jgi:diketogulonate reductase-like aldo/keto reductase
VEANEVSGDGMARACQASLSRLGTSFLDLYLLHWPVPNSQFSDVVEGFEQLRAARKIKTWGVSNFNGDQMEDLFRIPDGNRCATTRRRHQQQGLGSHCSLSGVGKAFDVHRME